jgi:hypothetical protein
MGLSPGVRSFPTLGSLRFDIFFIFISAVRRFLWMHLSARFTIA